MARTDLLPSLGDERSPVAAGPSFLPCHPFSSGDPPGDRKVFPVPPAPGSWFGRNEFLIRRLHSLTGLVPVGAYMVVHLLTNASTLGGPAMFQKNVDLIHSLGPALPIVEWTFIFLPLIFHAIVGVWIIRSGQSNLSSYHYVGNVRYYLQRLTAWIALFFIAWHVFQMHGWFHNDWWLKNIANERTGGHLFDPHAASST